MMNKFANNAEAIKDFTNGKIDAKQLSARLLAVTKVENLTRKVELAKENLAKRTEDLELAKDYLAQMQKERDVAESAIIENKS